MIWRHGKWFSIVKGRVISWENSGICILDVKLKKGFSLCDDTTGHRGVNRTLDKFQRIFFVLSACDKICRLVERCDVCLTKERSIKAKMRPHEPSTVGNLSEILFIDLVTLWKTMWKNHYLLFPCTKNSHDLAVHIWFVIKRPTL